MGSLVQESKFNHLAGHAWNGDVVGDRVANVATYLKDTILRVLLGEAS